MSAPAVHRVRRLSWQVRAASPAQALALRSRLQAQTDALPALLDGVLAEVCGHRVPETLVWRLPRLTLRLALDNADLPDIELQPRLAAALREALADALAAAPQGLLGSEEAAADTTGATSVDDVKAAPPWRSTTSQAHAAFAHYLRHGSLSWPQQTLPPEEQLARLRDVAMAQFNDLRSAVDGNEALRRLQALLPGPPSGHAGALARWLALLPAADVRAWVDAVVRRGAMVGIAGTSLDTPAGQASVLATALGGSAEAVDVPSSARTDRAGVPGSGRDRPAALPGADVAALPVASEPSWVHRPALTPWRHEQSRLPVSATPALSAETAAASSQLVPLAGLVLLHPYLPRLLQGCGLVDERARQIDDAMLPRACALLHALAVGAATAQEYALPLVKLLLGRDPDVPLTTALPTVGPDDVAEVDALLAAVRTHWPALAGTGDEGLRVSFLQRRGLLSRGDGSWQLRMSREPFDLLLGLLPWGIGFVRTPWMPAPLTVEWPGT